MASRWISEVYDPALVRLAAVIGTGGDAVQAYCDVLETKWFRSEEARRDVGLQPAIDAYIASGMVGPEISGAISSS
jgi:hypothetical protein